jgi:hypothetical protein
MPTGKLLWFRDDGRTLRVSGRTEQFNWKCLPKLKAACVEAAKDDGVTIAEWMEEAILSKLKRCPMCGKGQTDH